MMIQALRKVIKRMHYPLGEGHVYSLVGGLSAEPIYYHGVVKYRQKPLGRNFTQRDAGRPYGVIHSVQSFVRYLSLSAGTGSATATYPQFLWTNL